MRKNHPNSSMWRFVVTLLSFVIPYGSTLIAFEEGEWKNWAWHRKPSGKIEFSTYWAKSDGCIEDCVYYLK